MKWQSLALLLLLATAAVLPTRAEDDAEVDSDEDDEDEERAVLLIRRVVADERPLEGKQTTVTISIYNAGKATATDITATDRPWPETFAVEGDLSAKFDRIPEGSSVQFSYKVASKEKGFHQHPPTFVTYTPGEDEAQQSASSSILAFRTFTIIESIAAKALELGSTVTGGNFNSVQDWQRLALIAGVAGVALLAWRSYGSVTESNRNRRRAKALAALGELEKDK
ncbi:Translocon-associated subunit beta [Micractinium conductrix]|uniref:Translocon-associated subunit beta n=1 Tax=Micractinium conductrix TaxID=554055 RepID=A0A2P6V4R0_9CHLO|nr:Translocon-associated subunit beta [Micractinium conductrix]|eukprot:PSC69075.1 Translocon-associated subunit beta [Micractinium conductrix]